MKRIYYLVAAVLALAVIAGGVLLYFKRGIPFVSEREQWTIGIYRSSSPFDFSNRQSWRNPVLTADDVADVPAKFVADPFLISEDETLYLFFEVFNLDTQQGDLAVAVSTDTQRWQYERIVLDEPFHLSYPYVFEWQNDHYLIPETYETDSIRLYRATSFPYEWSYVATLVDGLDFVDPSIAYFEGRWWLYAATTGNDTLYLYYADDLSGPWQEHPDSPIVAQNKHKARSSGRVLVYEERLFRYTMDVDPPVGTHQVWAYEVTELSPTTYAEERVGQEPVLQASGQGWNAQAMHQLDPHQVGPDEWVASVDGFGTYLVFGFEY